MGNREVPDYLRGVPSPIWNEIDAFFGYDDYQSMTPSEIRVMARGLQRVVTKLRKIANEREVSVKWDKNTNGTIRKNSPVNVRLALEEIGWDDIPHPDKYDREKIVDRIEEKCGYRPTETVLHRVIEDMVLLL